MKGVPWILLLLLLLLHTGPCGTSNPAMDDADIAEILQNMEHNRQLDQKMNVRYLTRFFGIALVSVQFTVAMFYLFHSVVYLRLIRRYGRLDIETISPHTVPKDKKTTASRETGAKQEFSTNDLEEKPFGTPRTSAEVVANAPNNHSKEPSKILSMKLQSKDLSIKRSIESKASKKVRKEKQSAKRSKEAAGPSNKGPKQWSVMQKLEQNTEGQNKPLKSHKKSARHPRSNNDPLGHLEKTQQVEDENIKGPAMPRAKKGYHEDELDEMENFLENDMKSGRQNGKTVDDTVETCPNGEETRCVGAGDASCKKTSARSHTTNCSKPTNTDCSLVTIAPSQCTSTSNFSTFTIDSNTKQ